MTPAARYAAAIEILDQILTGAPAEKALTSWARRSRFAGSKDRAAIRDHVFDVLRRKRSTAALGGGASGRAMVLGLLRQQGLDPEMVFTGEGHAPAPLSEAERDSGDTETSEAVALDLPDWLMPELQRSLGDQLADYGASLRDRAPVMLRVNLGRITRGEAITKLAAEGIDAVPAEIADTALLVQEGARRINNSEAYRSGLVELQDGASQAVVAALPLQGGQRILDLCAGGGGKTLAMAGRVAAEFFAYDKARARLNDLPQRAARAGIQVALPQVPEHQGPYDLVLCDVPCSGSGSWRRAPEGKWMLNAERLQQLAQLQQQILQRAAAMVAQGGTLAYATCSVLDCENQAPLQGFLDQNPGWRLQHQSRWLPAAEGDGFFLALLTAD